MESKNNLLKGAASQLDFEINFEKILSAINNRSTMERIKLAARRGVSTFLNIAVLGGGMLMIILVQDREEEITEYMTKEFGDSFEFF